MSAAGAYHGAAVAVSNGSWLTLQGSADPTDSLVACNTVLKTPETTGEGTYVQYGQRVGLWAFGYKVFTWRAMTSSIVDVDDTYFWSVNHF